jgi:hypothetical protein
MKVLRICLFVGILYLVFHIVFRMHGFFGG